MLNTTEAARQAYRLMDQMFLALQAVREKLDAARAEGPVLNYALYAEWEEACRHFRRAHEEWRALAWSPSKPPTLPNIDLEAFDPSAIDIDGIALEPSAVPS